MVKEDHKRGSTNPSIEKPFPLLVTNLNGLFSKISLRIHQTYTREKCLSQHGFSENGGVQTFGSLKQFE